MTMGRQRALGLNQRIRLGLLTGAAVLCPGMVMAQTAPVVSSDPATSQSSPISPPPANTAAPVTASSATPAETGGVNAGAIEDIVVTARFRRERLQDTPLSISAFNARAIENSVITDVASIQKFLPNIQLSQNTFSGNALTASIRGISFSDLEKSFDPAIGVSIDGVFLGTNTGANIDINDIESIEVLRGPQGTLYGRNTIGGTITVRRTRPTGILGAKLHARYGSYDSLDLDGVINLPKIADVFSLKIYGMRRTSDSFTRSRQTGEREKGRDYYNIGGSLLADLGLDTTAQLTVNYQKDRSEYPSNINLTKAGPGTFCSITRAAFRSDVGCDTQSFLLSEPDDFRTVNTTIPFQSFFEGYDATLEANTRLGAFNVTSVTGYRESNDQLTEEGTGAPALVLGPGISVPLAVTARDQIYNQFSQEVRVQGNLSESVDLVFGGYYLHTRYAIQPGLYNGSRAATLYAFGSPAASYRAGQTLNSYAAFAESIIKLGSAVRLTVGGRYTTETKEFNIAQTLPTAFTARGKKTFKDPTGRVILDWKPNPDTMLYASASRGVRSGGFNGRATRDTAIGPYDPEHVNSYEAGVKATLAGGLIRFNPTVFWADYSDKQEEILRAAPGAAVGVTETVVQNAASARIRGVELEIQARPTPDLTLRTSGGYLQGKYKSFLIPNLAVPGTTIDVADARNFRRLPKYTLNAGVDYLRSIGGGNSFNLTIDYAYISKFTTSLPKDPFGRDTIAGNDRFDASLSFIHSGPTLKKLRVSAFIRDAFNRGGRLQTAVDAGPFFFGILTPRRQTGVEASVAF